MLHLTFVYISDDDEEPVVISQVESPVVPRIGDSIVLTDEDADENDLPTVWDVIDIFFQLPTSGAGEPLTHVTLYLEPRADSDDDDDDEDE